MTDLRSRPSSFGMGSVSRRACVVALISVAVTVGCSGKTDAQLASASLADGLTAQAASNLTLAGTDYLDCLKHDAMNEYCLYDLGLIAQTQNRPAAAENDYRLAMVSDPDFGAAIFNLAIIRTQAGATQEAISLYRHYIQVAPTDAGGYLNLGLLLRATGDTVNGSADIAIALRLNPKLVVPASPAPPAVVPVASPAPTEPPLAGPSASAGADASPTASPTK
jgi:tetratricopeptide (TPR) repeat protein